MKLSCPYCKKAIELQAESLVYRKDGREAHCPECGGKIVLRRFINHPVRGRPKHMSKKERLRQWAADAAKAQA